MSDEKEDEKTTSEKPVSLSPLRFLDALKGLLGVEPKQEAENLVEVEQEEKPNE